MLYIWTHKIPELPKNAHLCDTVPLYLVLTAWRQAYHITSNPTLDVYGGTRNEGNISYIPDISVW